MSSAITSISTSSTILDAIKNLTLHYWVTFNLAYHVSILAGKALGAVLILSQAYLTRILQLNLLGTPYQTKFLLWYDLLQLWYEIIQFFFSIIWKGLIYRTGASMWFRINRRCKGTFCSRYCDQRFISWTWSKVLLCYYHSFLLPFSSILLWVFFWVLLPTVIIIVALFLAMIAIRSLSLFGFCFFLLLPLPFRFGFAIGRFERWFSGLVLSFIHSPILNMNYFHTSSVNSGWFKQQ